MASEIQTVIGYDQALLGESTDSFEIEVPFDEILPQLKKIDDQYPDESFFAYSGGHIASISFNGVDCSLCVNFYRHGGPLGRIESTPLVRIDTSLPQEFQLLPKMTSRGKPGKRLTRQCVQGKRVAEVYSFKDVPRELPEKFRKILTPDQADRLSTAYSKIMSGFYVPKRGEIHDIVGYDEALLKRLCP